MSTNRTCPSCGTPASESERFCANCGTRLGDLPPAAAPTMVIGPQGEPPATPTPPQGALRVPADAASPPARKGLPLWAMLLLGLGGLCALGCVGAFVALSFFGQQVAGVASTAVVEQSTALAELEATPGGAGGIAGGAAAQAQTTQAGGQAATPEVILTLPTEAPGGGGGVLGGGAAGAASQARTAEAATAQAAGASELDALFASATLAFQDEFVDNRNAWFIGQVSDIETDLIEDGVFKIRWAGKGTTYEPYQVREFTSFIAELDCRAAQGGVNAGCAIIFGERTDVGFYKFEVYEDYYSLYIVPSPDEAPPLLEGNPAEFINQGDWNRLRVIKQGDTISVFLNEVPLGSVSDATYPTGHVGVSTASFAEEGGVEVWFDNFTIWELP